MQLPLLTLSLFLMTAHTVWPTIQDPGTKEKSPVAQETPPSIGQVVSEIDPRIWKIHQGRNGDLWFGSNGNGVYRFDGERAIQYTRADGLSGHHVRDIKEDSVGNLLISTTDGISKFDGEKLTTLIVVDTPQTMDEWVLDPNDTWIVLAPGKDGPGRYDGETLYHMKLPKSPAEDAFRASHPSTSFSPTAVYTVYKDQEGQMWFGTTNVGLCRYDGQTVSWMHEERLTTTSYGGAFGIRSIYQDREGSFWVTNTRQRFKIKSEIAVQDGYSLIQYETKKGLPDAGSDTDENFSYYPSMTEDDKGALWMACGGDGVWKYAGQDVTHYPLTEDAYAITVYCDVKGKVWVGTVEHGIFTFTGSEFEPFKLQAQGK